MPAVKSSLVHPAYKTEYRVGNAMRRAAITGKRNPHRLRHSYASRVYRVSRDLRMVQKLLGHSRVDTTSIYADIFDEWHLPDFSTRAYERIGG